MGKNTDKFYRQVVEIIDRLRNMPVIYEQATREERIKIIRSKANGIIVRGEAIQILWKKPYSYLLKDEVLEHKKKQTSSKFENRPFQLAGIDDFRTLWKMYLRI